MKKLLLIVSGCSSNSHMELLDDSSQVAAAIGHHLPDCREACCAELEIIDGSIVLSNYFDVPIEVVVH